MKQQFWKYYFFVIITLILVLFSCFYFSEGIVGINKTVNWAWDFTNFVFWLELIIYLTVIFLMVYVLTKILVQIINYFTK
ncbi:MAG: hypothetical protein CMO82_12475 [Winogradskyella sp.]|nr:hypothetical protein [Winogradskyella sp.]